MQSVPARSDEFLAAYRKHGGNITRAAAEMGVSRATGQYYVRRLGLAGAPPTVGGRMHGDSLRELPLPGPGEVRRHILTCAQSCTLLNDAVWKSLETARRHFEKDGPCTIEVSRFTYNQNQFGKLSVKPGTAARREDELWYDARVSPHASDENVLLAPGLVWCGRMNISPTAVDPLSDLENYTRRRSGIFPHVKVALRSVATLHGEGTKFNYTTGTVTQRNYVERKAGQKADFHHTYGALLVEVDHEGTWFCRQLIADAAGKIQDLDVIFDGDRVLTGRRVAAITWGDVHSRHLDPVVKMLGWDGDYCMLDALRPEEQHVHDLLDQYARQPHDRDDPHRMFQRFVENLESVEDEVIDAAHTLGDMDREWSRTYVINSNHDGMMERWLRETDYRKDPLNALFFLRAQLAVYEAIAAGERGDFVLLEWACRAAGCPENVVFLREDESHVICDDIECGMHGHLGLNGARATASGLAKMGRRANTAHTHSAEIRDGMYVCGTSSKLRLIYNSGPSSWSHSHTITYATGKRAIVTMYDGKWRALPVG